MAERQVVTGARWLILALAAAGFGTGGAWSNEGFSQTTYGWKASYPSGASSLLGDDWRLDNWERQPSTTPGDSSSTYGEKTGPGYTVSHGEGAAQYLYDLKFVHASDQGAIWIKTSPLEAGDARKSLETLTEGYLRAKHDSAVSLAGLGFSVTAVTDRTETRLGGRRALAVSLNASVTSAPEGEPRRIDLLLTKYDYSWTDMTPTTSTDGVGPPSTTRSVTRVGTAFMVIGYVNTASRFDAARGDLDKLVARLSWSPSPSGGASPQTPATPEEEGESHWTATGFEQRRYGWKAAYSSGGHDFVSADWRLHEGSARSGYTGSADLSFENVHNNGFIWTDTSTLSMDEATKDLDVLFENYVGRLSELGFGGHAVISSRDTIKLGPHAAVSATIQREPTAAEREGRTKTIATQLRIVVTKFEYLERPERPGLASERRVAFMVVGYANDSSRFDGSLEEFARFLGRITWPSSPTAPGGKPASKPDAPPGSPAKPVDPNQPTVET